MLPSNEYRQIFPSAVKMLLARGKEVKAENGVVRIDSFPLDDQRKTEHSKINHYHSSLTFTITIFHVYLFETYIVCLFFTSIYSSRVIFNCIVRSVALHCISPSI